MTVREKAGKYFLFRKKVISRIQYWNTKIFQFYKALLILKICLNFIFIYFSSVIKVFEFLNYVKVSHNKKSLQNRIN